MKMNGWALTGASAAVVIAAVAAGLGVVYVNNVGLAGPDMLATIVDGDKH